MTKEKSRIRVPNRQAWIDTFVYMCPWHEGTVGGMRERCTYVGKPYTNCTGRGTFSWGGCTQVKEYFDTFCKFVEKTSSKHSTR